jgi:hypothetical protein
LRKATPRCAGASSPSARSRHVHERQIHAAAFDSAVDAIGDLVERLVDANVRLSQLEAMAADGTDIVARLDAFDARLTALEKRQRRPPTFPITVHERVQYDPTLHPAVLKMWDDRIQQSVAG